MLYVVLAVRFYRLLGQPPPPTPAAKAAAMVLGGAGLKRGAVAKPYRGLHGGCTIVLPQDLAGEDALLFAAALAASSLTGVSLDMSLLAVSTVADVLPTVVADLERRGGVSMLLPSS